MPRPDDALPPGAEPARAPASAAHFGGWHSGACFLDAVSQSPPIAFPDRSLRREGALAQRNQLLKRQGRQIRRRRGLGGAGAPSAGGGEPSMPQRHQFFEGGLGTGPLRHREAKLREIRRGRLLLHLLAAHDLRLDGLQGERRCWGAC